MSITLSGDFIIGTAVISLGGDWSFLLLLVVVLFHFSDKFLIVLIRSMQCSLFFSLGDGLPLYLVEAYWATLFMMFHTTSFIMDLQSINLQGESR